MRPALLAGVLLGLIAGCQSRTSAPAKSSRTQAVSKASVVKPTGTSSERSNRQDSSPEQTVETPAISPATSELKVEPEAGETQTVGSPHADRAAQAEPVFRPADTRPRHDSAKAAELGIRKYTSKRLILYTDIPAAKAEPLPALMDEAYDAWVAYLGPLPPARDGSEFQMTGYIMANQAPFRETGLLPADLRPFLNGRHRGQEFWMNDQTEDYYRAHLMVHEGTHCFMTIVPNPLQAGPWYIEGMAELFGTHQRVKNGKTLFRVMPHDPVEFSGLERITIIRDAVSAGKTERLPDVLGFQAELFMKNEMYAWSWGLCEFLDKHPRYRERFRKIEESIHPGRELEDMHTLFRADWLDLQEEWLLFASHLVHGHDIARAAIDFQPGKPLAMPGGKATAQILADRGWQSSRVQVEKGRVYEIRANGQVTLAKEPQPWISEPQGVSIRYSEGRPIGQLLACVRSASALTEPPYSAMLQEYVVGRRLKFTAPVTGTLYLRVNDFWNELADNSGKYDVTIEAVAAAP